MKINELPNWHLVESQYRTWLENKMKQIERYWRSLMAEVKNQNALQVLYYAELIKQTQGQIGAIRTLIGDVKDD